MSNRTTGHYDSKTSKTRPKGCMNYERYSIGTYIDNHVNIPTGFQRFKWFEDVSDQKGRRLRLCCVVKRFQQTLRISTGM